ncbi:MAG: leucine-rich repeat domain-containing protein, partial [Treponema sp.]|nr:leucine-rich repeat domain-containing protein [Treponema sp.]
MKKIDKILALGLLTISALFFSCKNDLQEKEINQNTNIQNITNQDESTGPAYIGFKEELSDELRNASNFKPELFDIEDKDFSFELLGIWNETDQKVLKVWESTEESSAYDLMLSDVLEIDAGIWFFTLNAIKNSGYIYTKSISNQKITAGYNYLDFGKLEEVKEGNGSVNITVNFPADSDCTQVIATLFNIDRTPVEGFESENLTISINPENDEQKQVTYFAEDVPVGNYRLNFVLYDDENVILQNYPCTVTVSNYNTTNGTGTIENVNKYYKIIYHDLDSIYNGVSGYTLVDGYALPERYSINQTIVFPDETQLTKGSYYVGAWYTNEERTGETITGWQCDEMAEDIHVYPKWCVSAEKASAAIQDLPATEVSTKYILRVTGELSSSILKEIASSLSNAGTNALVNLNIEETTGLTSLATEQFKNKTNLYEIELPSSLATIETYAFYGCNKLEKITIPESVTTISDYVFNGCTGLKE